ncbi:SP_1767 family glycosyltransferase [uncultured Bacteroides sp.]|uniref:SP_1767 family glycosyltransferase n=1 Tax=uncultured Bacteroides sp. TaxID=162156 RepID=UPI00280AE76E|nr:SP_1767 family glycosyltransferase [uncultured Bacteroides sp.]
MNIQLIIQTIKSKLRYGCIVEWYNFWYIVLRKSQKQIPQIASIDETIQKIVKEGCSVSRFGDGEILLTNNKAIGFQKADSKLGERLKEVLQSNADGHIVCLSDTFTDIYRYNRKARRFWRTHFFIYGHIWDNLLISNKQYYNTFVTRPYMDFAQKTQCGKWFHDMQAIWQDRNIIFIEGEKSRLGVGNDLFHSAKSIKRILCPPTSAFDKYDYIINEAVKQNKDVLFLIALGPTATVLAYDLHKKSYQAIDIGHVDIEYEWWRMNAKRKVKIQNKYVNEAVGGNIVSVAGEEYESQIIAKIL